MTKRSPPTVTDLLKAADGYIDRGDLDAALGMCNHAVQLDPQNPDAWNKQGYVLAHLGENAYPVAMQRKYFDAALTAENNAIEINPQSDGAWVIKSFALFKLTRFQEAIDACDYILRSLDRNNVSAFENKAESQLALGDVDGFHNTLDRVKKLHPTNFELWCRLGDTLIAQKYPRLALEAYDLILDEDPHFTDALYGKARGYDVLGKFKEALHFVDAAIKQDPEKTALFVLKHNIDFKMRGKTKSSEVSWM